jgi:hypothetical protein
MFLCVLERLEKLWTDVCLCLSALPVFLTANVVAALGVTLAGEQVVNDILTALVSGSKFLD